MSRGTIALILGLFVLSALIIFVISAVLVASGTLDTSENTQGIGLLQLMWMGLLRTLDSGTMGGDVGSVPFLMGMLAVTFGGIFVISTLIGVISSGIEGKMDELRKGRSRVLEAGHTVVLGWSAQVFDIISEIVLANANKRNQVIVVLADRDKVEMEDEIRQRIPDTKTTRIVCRSGSPIDLDDLALASLPTSRSIIVLAPESDEPDTDVIKTLLAITNDPARRPEPYRIVTEIREPNNLEVARLACGGEAQIILGGELIGRIAAQACRQPGLSVIYQELLDYGGDEMYFFNEPTLAGMTFADALLEYRTSALIGIAPAGGEPTLNPSMTTVIGADDRLVFISADDDTIIRQPRPEGALMADAIVARTPRPQTPERTLVLGWNSRTPGLVSELDRYVSAGSTLTVVADGEGIAAAVAEVGRGLGTLKPTFVAGDTTERALLNRVVAQGWDHVVVMSYSDTLDEQRADARTLVTLLHLRDIEAHHQGDFTIVSEMLDVRNRALAQVTRADDFIVSAKLVSLMMTQLAETPDLRPVLDDLFDEAGSEVYLKPASDYVKPDVPIDMYTLVEAARGRGEICFGYRLAGQANDPDKAYGVVINPDKAKTFSLAASDKVIVLAED